MFGVAIAKLNKKSLVYKLTVEMCRTVVRQWRLPHVTNPGLMRTEARDFREKEICIVN